MSVCGYCGKGFNEKVIETRESVYWHAGCLVKSHEALLEAAKLMRDTITSEQEQDGLKDYTEGFVVAFDKLEKAISQTEARP